MRRTYGLMDLGQVHAHLLGLADPLVMEAMIASFEGFKKKKRKLPEAYPDFTKPRGYFVHPLELALLMAAYGYPACGIAAALLHDHVEDLKGWTFERIEKQFGDLVSVLVRLVTQPNTGSWEERREAYYVALRDAHRNPKVRAVAKRHGVDPLDIQKIALAISCCDKISNVRGSVKLARKGFMPDDHLSKGWKANDQVWRRLLELFRGRVHPLLFKEYELQITRLATFAEARNEFDQEIGHEVPKRMRRPRRRSTSLHDRRGSLRREIRGAAHK